MYTVTQESWSRGQPEYSRAVSSRSELDDAKGMAWQLSRQQRSYWYAVRGPDGTDLVFRKGRQL